jgi:3,4-dihydroxy 2-butanone 4-phosphate synthase / GTP cyclohydrolase II
MSSMGTHPPTSGSSRFAREHQRAAAAAAALGHGRVVLILPHPALGEAPSLAAAAETVTPELVNEMLHHGGGVLRLSLHGGACDRLGLHRPRDRRRTDAEEQLAPTIEARDGVTTGISAADRARTLLVAGAPNASREDLTTPGHIVAVRAAAGGVLGRPGIAEAALELCRLGGRHEAAVLCHVLDERGEPATGAHAREVARRMGTPSVDVEEIVAVARRDTVEWLRVPA